MLSASSPQESLADVKNTEVEEPVEDAVEPKLKMGLIENVRKLWDSVRMTVFVVGTALTVFVAARNTITWYSFSIYLIHFAQFRVLMSLLFLETSVHFSCKKMKNNLI